MNLKELDSFKLSDAVTFHDHLNPALWVGHKLKPAIKDQLLIIAKDFLEELGVDDLDVVDITVSGSNAAYSYTKHSDLDLHILVDMSKLNNDDVYKELFNAKKTLYNDSHHITVNNVPVELYVQDSNEPVVSLGEYSILRNEWLRLPTKRRANFDQTATKEKYAKLQKLIEVALLSKDLHKVEAVLKTIKRYRQAGLDKGGEFGPENLAFKALRSQGYITKLYQLRDKLHSQALTFETMYQDPIKIQEKINSKIIKKDFHAEKDINIKDVGPLKLVAYNISDEHPQQFKIDVVHPDGKKIGYFRFVVHDYEPEPKFKLFAKFKDKKDPYVLAGNVSVWNEFQKKGIASEVYKWVKSMGNDIRPSSTQTPAGKAMWRGFEKNQIADEDYDPNGPPPGPEFKPTMPAGTVKVDVSDVYDWYKLGQHISNLKGLGKHDFGAGPPSTIMAFGDEDTEHEYIKDLEKTGLTTTDIDPVDPKQPKGMKRQKVDPTYNVNEAVTDNYLYHATQPAGMMRILRSGAIKASYRPQEATKARTQHPTVSTTRSKQYAESDDFVNFLNLTNEGNSVIIVLDRNAVANHYKMFSTSQGTQTVGDEFEEVIVVPKGAMPIQSTMKGFYFNPKRTAEIEEFKDTPWFKELLNSPYYMGPKQGVAEDDTMQYAASKTAAINPYGGLKDRQYRGAISETFDKPYPIKWEKSEFGDYDALATLPDGNPLTIMFNHESPDEVVITFWRNNNLELTGEGDAQRVFATVLQAIQEFLKIEQPEIISFSASKEVEPGQNMMSRSKLYDRLVSRYAQQWGYNAKTVDHEEGVVYNLTRKQNVAEASGYIPSEKEKNDPRFKTALTVDVKPDSIKKNAKAFSWLTDRAGIPPTAKSNGKF